MFRKDEMHRNLKNMKDEVWLGRMEPCRIVNGVYFVGTYQASCHIIDTGEGLIMIDPGYFETTYLVLDSLYKLGYKPSDIKYIINTHWHWDHVAATAAFVDLSGAKTLIGRDDEAKALDYFTPDFLIDDGDTLTLGNTTVHFLVTPGHTKGTISFFFDVVEKGEVLRVGMFGGAGVNTLARGKFDFEGCREAYLASLDRLALEHVDVFIGNHTWNNDTYNKSLQVLAGNEDAFIDSTLWQKFLDSCRARYMRVLKKESEQA